MKLKNLVGKGYFPSELPRPFTAEDFGKAADSLALLWKAKKIDKYFTQPERLNHPRYGHARRNISIVNPINQLRVSELIVDNWAAIRTKLKTSAISEFKPFRSTSSERAVPGVNFAAVNRRRVRILARYGRYIKTDIVRFYPSIYTHSIGWAVHGKSWVKDHIYDPTYVNSFANKLDAAVRAGQRNQTIGIPIGPDTSRIISELIITELERDIVKAIPDLKTRGVRYVDDFILGVSRDEAPEALLSKISASLYEYDLDLGAEKTTVHGIGHPHAPEWINYIRGFALPSRPGTQRDSLDSYFEQALYLADANPRENVLLFAVKRAAALQISEENWFHLIDWLLYCARRSTTCIPFVTEFLATAKVDKKGLPVNSLLVNFVHEMLASEAAAAHTSEVSWLLFCARELNIKVNQNALGNVTKLRSSACAMIALDLAESGKIVGALDEDYWRSFANADGLKSEMWLTAYEATRKGWWKTPVSKAFITGEEYFKELDLKQIEFYKRKLRAKAVTHVSFFKSVFASGSGGSDPYP